MFIWPKHLYFKQEYNNDFFYRYNIILKEYIIDLYIGTGLIN
jgi:hypothetical protein